jgi:hypothetical protein
MPGWAGPHWNFTNIRTRCRKDDLLTDVFGDLDTGAAVLKKHWLFAFPRDVVLVVLESPA